MIEKLLVFILGPTLSVVFITVLILAIAFVAIERIVYEKWPWEK